MTKIELKEFIKSEIEPLREKYYLQTLSYWSNQLEKFDFYFTFSQSILKKNLRIAFSIFDEINKNNESVIGILIRAMIDNILFLTALDISINKDDFLKGILEGNQLKNFKDHFGRLMYNEYLVEVTSEKCRDIDIIKLYKHCNKFVHNSELTFEFKNFTNPNIIKEFFNPANIGRNILESFDYDEIHFFAQSTIKLINFFFTYFDEICEKNSVHIQ